MMKVIKSILTLLVLVGFVLGPLYAGKLLVTEEVHVVAVWILGIFVIASALIVLYVVCVLAPMVLGLAVSIAGLILEALGWD